MEMQPYVHRHSGERVMAHFFEKKQQWPIWGASKVMNSYTKEQEFQTETVEAGDAEVVAGKVGSTWGTDKEERFIVPKWAFPLCYVAPESVTPPSITVAEVSSEAPQHPITSEGFDLFNN